MRNIRNEGCKPANKVKSKRTGATSWALKITPVTFCLSLASSIFSQAVTTYTDLTVSIMLLLFMMLVSVVFDGIGVSVTSCDKGEVKKLLQYDAKRAKIAMGLISNAEKVNSVCADVIGDICGVLSGACGAVLAAGLVREWGAGGNVLPTLTSAVVAAITVGGKALMKGIAVKNADKYVVMTAKALSYIYKPKNKNKKEIRK